MTLGVLWEQRSSGPPNERECVCEMKDGFKQTVRGVMGKGFGSGAVVQWFMEQEEHVWGKCLREQWGSEIERGIKYIYIYIYSVKPLHVLQCH